MLTLFKIFFNNLSPEGILYGAFNIGAENGKVTGAFIPLLLIGILWIAASYFLGSLNFSIIISKLIYHDDVRKHGSANAGSTNMQRTYGNKAGVLTLICDMAKGIVAVLIARVLFGENIAYLSGLACVLGHCFPCYFSFKGGKGVATAAAVILALNPLVFLFLILIFVLLVLATRYISLGSIIAAMLFPVALDRYYEILANAGASEFTSPTMVMTLCSILIAAIVVIRHHGNIKKLINKEENKISFKSKKKDRYSSDNTGAKQSLHNIDSED